MAAVHVGANSAASKGRLKVAMKIFNESFRKRDGSSADPDPVKSFDMLDVEALCERHLWEQFGGYLANKGGYVISTGPRNGEMLGGGAVLGYVSALMNHAKAKYYGAVTERERDGNVVQFFTCVNQNAHTESWTWYTSLRSNLNRIVFQRKS